MPENPLSNENVAERLKVVRKAVAGTQTAFCKRIGIEVQRWNNFERGLPNSVGLLLVQKIPGLTLHWLFLGKSGWVATPTSRWVGVPQRRSYNPEHARHSFGEGAFKFSLRVVGECAACELRPMLLETRLQHRRSIALPKKKQVVRREWTKNDIKELKAHSKARTPVAKISKATKRTVGALRQKALNLGIGLGHQR
jgi:transcriptional regulator with XRE-family HTH domain